MFKSIINEINSKNNEIINNNFDINKRSKVCDADGNGNLNPNCKR